jgi:hypothetical protein
MKLFLTVVSFLMFNILLGQSPSENIIIISTDGLRWQEVFKGMDSAIANNKKFNQGDSDYLFKKYWAASDQERRKKLLPFLWSVIEKNGQVFGNRLFENKIDNANPYWFSYPGYSEIMTGFVDTAINSNSYPPNPNITVLEFLNNQPKLKGKVAAFGAWEAFNRILNEKRSGIPVIAAFDDCGGKLPSPKEKLINEMLKNSFKPFGEEECLDVFTHYAAIENLKIKKPRVLYIGYGETDEWAHAGRYKDYLDAARQVDEWVKEIWNFVQTDASYKNKTTLFITTDHGRGDIKKEEWTSHGQSIKDAHEIWFATMGPSIAAKGELKNKLQLFQQQFAQTFAELMGYTFKASHPVTEAISELFKK